MRRARDLKEHKDALRRKAIEQRQRRRKQKTKTRVAAAKKQRAEVVEKRQLKELRHVGAQAVQALKLDLQPFEEYTCQIKSPPLKICHVIESLGMGGGQTMMMELIKALNKYYPDHVQNILCCPRPTHQKFDKGLYHSYGVAPAVMREKDFSRFLARENIRLVLQHRLAVSKCLKSMLPSNVKYVVMNHTYHQLGKLSGFLKADAYVSVCEYLHRETRWSRAIHPSRTMAILNGVENDYLVDIEPAKLDGEFKTGRCHRLVSNKFRVDSLKWMESKVKKHIPGHRHYLLGHNGDAKKLCKKGTVCKYFGTVSDRNRKMSILKALDLYFYETFGQEGASIAILEALACVPKSQKLFVNGRLQVASDVCVGDVIYGGRVLKTFDNGLAEILNIKPMGLPSFRVTSDHRVRIYDVQSGESWKKACNLAPGDYLIFPKYKLVSNSVIDLTRYRQRRKCKVDLTHLSITPDLAYLLGWYLAEGDSSSNGAVTFSLSGSELHVAKELARICRTELKLQFHERKNPGESVIRWYFCHAVLARWFKDVFGSNARSKRIPDVVLNLPADLLRRFLEGYAKGDGWYNLRKMKTVMSTSSLELSYQLILAYSKLDQLAVWQKKNKTEHKAMICGREVTVHPSWNVSVVPYHAKSRKRYLQDDQNFYLPISSISVSEKENVVNYTTDTSRYCAPFVITHNCGVPVLCKDFGGNLELIQEGVNGYVVNSREEYLMRMKDLQDKEKLAELRASTVEDFNSRLHIKHTAAKYMQLFEALV